MSTTIYQGNTLVCLITVIDETSGSAKDISGATITAKAANAHGTEVNGGVVVTDAAAGKFTVSFSAGALTLGDWIMEARVEIGSESQIVAEEIIAIRRAYL